jgi:hypothetical protein
MDKKLPDAINGKKLSDAISAIPMEIYKGREVMKSTDLHKVIYSHTGKYKELNDFHEEIKEILEDESDSILLSAQKRNNGYIEYYRLSEKQVHHIALLIDVDFARYVFNVVDAASTSSCKWGFLMDFLAKENEKKQKSSDPYNTILSSNLSEESKLKAIELYTQVDIAKEATKTARATYSDEAVIIAKAKTEVAKAEAAIAKAKARTAKVQAEAQVKIAKAKAEIAQYKEEH